MAAAAEKTPANENSLADVNIVTKYKEAALIANNALKAVLAAAVVGKPIVELCQLGDKFIADETAKVFKGKNIEKGVGFPTCVCVNSLVGHFSPLPSEAAGVVIASGDVVKVDLGCHIDGYLAVAAHTIVVGAEGPIEGRKADVLLAAYACANVAKALCVAGAKTQSFSEPLTKTAKSFNCNLVAGIVSHDIKRNVLDGNKVIATRVDPEDKATEAAEIQPDDVFVFDILVSTGEGKTKVSESRTTVYKRQADEVYQLKMKTSRALFSEIKKRFSAFPFSLRELDEKTARMGIVECSSHGVVKGYQVLAEKNDKEYVAQIKFTVLLTPGGAVKITGLPLEADNLKSEFSVTDPALQALIATANLDKKAAKKAKKAAGAGAAGAVAEDAPAAPGGP